MNSNPFQSINGAYAAVQLIQRILAVHPQLYHIHFNKICYLFYCQLFSTSVLCMILLCFPGPHPVCERAAYGRQTPGTLPPIQSLQGKVKVITIVTLKFP